MADKERLICDAGALVESGRGVRFEVDYFGERKAYLTHSGQLYAEAGALALGKV